MASRPRVAAALTNDDTDTLADSIREDLRAGTTPGGQQDDPPNEPEDDDESEGDEPEGDEPESDEPEGDEPEGDEPQQRQPLRTQRRVERDDNYISPAAQTRIDEANRIATETQARLTVFEQQFQQRGESPEQEAARLALMTPEQQTEYRVNKSLSAHNRTIQQTLFNTQNVADKATFEATIASTPALKRFATDVEKKHSELVRNAQRDGGQIPTRQMVLTFMLGERALKLAAEAEPQRQARTRRVQNQRVREPDTRSDVGRQGRRQTTAEQRLAGVQL